MQARWRSESRARDSPINRGRFARVRTNLATLARDKHLGKIHAVRNVIYIERNLVRRLRVPRENKVRRPRDSRVQGDERTARSALLIAVAILPPEVAPRSLPFKGQEIIYRGVAATYD